MIHSVDKPLHDAARLALCGGVALYLVGHVGFRLRMVGAVSRAKVGAAIASLVLFALGGGLPAWATAAALTLVLSVLVVSEVIGERPAPQRQARPAPG
jgi:hypothetical protein